MASDLGEDAVVFLEGLLVGDGEGFEAPFAGASEIAVGEVDQGKVSATSGESGEIAEFVVKAEQLSGDAEGLGKIAIIAIDADEVLEGGFAQAGIAGIAATLYAAFEEETGFFPIFEEVIASSEVKIGGGLGDGIVFAVVGLDTADAKTCGALEAALCKEDGEASPSDDEFEGLMESERPSQFAQHSPAGEGFFVTLGEDGEFSIEVLCGAAAVAVAGEGALEERPAALESLEEEQAEDEEGFPEQGEADASLRRRGFLEGMEGIFERVEGFFGAMAVALCAREFIQEGDAPLFVFDEEKGILVGMSSAVVFTAPKVEVAIEDFLVDMLSAV